MKVIAEGVGSDDQIAFLRENGCVDIQGFAFSKPLPLDEVTDLLKQSQTRSAQ
jgi:EAL domain-containing protein (putative c-di-GMP-specific phosphodiesterase class I)